MLWTYAFVLQTHRLVKRTQTVVYDTRQAMVCALGSVKILNIFSAWLKIHQKYQEDPQTLNNLNTCTFLIQRFWTNFGDLFLLVEKMPDKIDILERFKYQKNGTFSQTN